MFRSLCFSFDRALLLVCRVPPTTTESGRNASGQEAFGSKTREALVEQSPMVSTTDMTSSAVGAGATAGSAAEKVEASTVGVLDRQPTEGSTRSR
jgi:hypothetical protein